MRLTRLYLQNYRVYQEPVEVELPPGLVGVYGLNGAGKSALLESIRFALYGRARTSNDLVRTSDVNDDCVAEVEFEHEGHLYLVRRLITGANSHVKALAHADGRQVAEGARDTTRYVQSILGMDDTAFRASVFAEQKQLAAFSDHTPTERRRLVLQLLGITPVDTARDRARKEAREAQQQVERLRNLLLDLDAVRADVEARREEADTAATKVDAVEKEAAALDAVAVSAERDHARLDAQRQEHELVGAELASLEAELQRSTARAARLTAELAGLDEAAEALARLAPEARGGRHAEAALSAVDGVLAAQRSVAAAAVPPEPPAPDEAGCEAARAAADEARTLLAEVDGLLGAARAEHERALDALNRSAGLSGGADCPLCGQALGDAFAQVQAHRTADLAEVAGRMESLQVRRRQAASGAEAAASAARAAAARLRDAQGAWATYERARARREEAQRALAGARAAVPAEIVDTGRLENPAACEQLRAELVADVDRRRRASDDMARIRGRLEHRPQLEANRAAEQLVLDSGEGRRVTLSEKVAAIGFSADVLAAARAARDRAVQAAAAAHKLAEAARLAAAGARVAAEASARRLAEAEEQHAKLGGVAHEARHLGRLAELLNAFRNNLVATVGPRLSAQAGELFAELTDHDYDALDVDPDTYEIRVSDRGRAYGMDRFSGSETDLANLALRVAISEHVQFQSGGVVGLLVLDEVFGPLDDDRKDRMLLALERLRARFRQVLVVTHDASIKERLPYAIEVVKLPGRRAAVRVLTS